MFVPNGWKAKVQPLPDQGLIHFSVDRVSTGENYTKSWWRGHLHALKLIFQGYEVEYVDPPEEAEDPSDPYRLSVLVTIDSEPDNGGNTLATVLKRLLDANRVPYEVVSDEEGEKQLLVGTFPGIQHTLAYDFAPNPFGPEQCHDETGKFRDPRTGLHLDQAYARDMGDLTERN